MNTNLFSDNISKLKSKFSPFDLVNKVENYFLSFKDIITQTPHLTPFSKGLLCELHNRKKSLEISFYEDNKISYLKIDNGLETEQKGVIDSKEDFLKLINWYFV